MKRNGVECWESREKSEKSESDDQEAAALIDPATTVISSVKAVKRCTVWVHNILLKPDPPKDLENREKGRSSVFCTVKDNRPESSTRTHPSGYT